ncbi:bacteriocin immunity protein [Streptomyces iakyrus]|uniref:bacteriocin immunity protein n=1 Tax=Streptomyces iakyrus TaxID=68219 RepID=UPI003801F209
MKGPGENMSASREDLVEIVRKFMAAEISEQDEEEMVELLERSVPHPRVLDLIYHPESEGLTEDATAEQVVDAALAYRPIEL